MKYPLLQLASLLEKNNKAIERKFKIIRQSKTQLFWLPLDITRAQLWSGTNPHFMFYLHCKKSWHVPSLQSTLGIWLPCTGSSVPYFCIIEYISAWVGKKRKIKGFWNSDHIKSHKYDEESIIFNPYLRFSRFGLFSFDVLFTCMRAFLLLASILIRRISKWIIS